MGYVCGWYSNCSFCAFVSGVVKRGKLRYSDIAMYDFGPLDVCFVPFYKTAI